jgi:hypothetical protein
MEEEPEEPNEFSEPVAPSTEGPSGSAVAAEVPPPPVCQIIYHPMPSFATVVDVPQESTYRVLKRQRLEIEPHPKRIPWGPWQVLGTGGGPAPTGKDKM